MKIYISGPMTGHVNLNESRFAETAEYIHTLGHTPVNPHDISMTVEASPGYDDPCWEDYMKADLAELEKCDAIFMMDGWTTSRGAKVEFEFAVAHGIRILYENLVSLSGGIRPVPTVSASDIDVSQTRVTPAPSAGKE
jgi:hypothetical protein